MTDLAGAITNQSPDNIMRTATVKSVLPLVLTVGGGDVTDAGSIALVNVGDTVAVIRQGQTWLVLGVISPAGASWGVMTGVRGSVNITIPTSATSVVTAHTGLFNLPRTPAYVGLNWYSRPGGTALWSTGALNYTTTGFTSASYGPSNTTGSPIVVRLDYMAVM